MINFFKIVPDKPHNPMLNSGAIMISSLALNLICNKMKIAEKFEYMQNYFKVRK